MRFRGVMLPLLAAMAFACALLSIARTQPHRAPADPPEAPPVSPCADTIAAGGLVESSSEYIAIGTHLTGIVERVLAVAGTRVQRGDLLFALDGRHLDAEIDARRAALVEAQRHVETERVASEDAAAHLAFSEAVDDPGAIARQELSGGVSPPGRAPPPWPRARLERKSPGAPSSRRWSSGNAAKSAPIDGVILKVDVRPGESVLAGAIGRPLLLLGETTPLHVRVDVDEHDAWRVSPGAGAQAMLRGRSTIASRLAFVRFEPYVTPKRSLTGDGTERVDTRVLQVIYRLEDAEPRWFVGQQVDVFIDGADPEVVQ